MRILPALILSLLVTMPAMAQDWSKDRLAHVIVYVYTEKDPSGFVDEEGQRKLDSVKDLKEELNKRGFTIVESESFPADMTFEVKVSAKLPTGATESSTSIYRGVLGGLHSDTTSNVKLLPTLAVTLRVPKNGYSTELVYQRQMFWKDLAKWLVRDKFEKWLRTNATILGK